MLDLTSLSKAVQSLGRVLVYWERQRKIADETEYEIIRAAMVQNFEFTYELAWKFMKRRLEVFYWSII